MFSRPLAIGISILVSTVWAANLVVGAFYPERHDATINAIFAIIVGAVFGLTPKRETLAAARRRLARTAGDREPEPPEGEQADETTTPRGDDS